jgi:DNA-binding CsgD family transcriptional regulator/tetratricopeptide (TPR) repeat protein
LLPGREREGAFLNELLNRIRGGRSAAIVVHGEAGVGKTALLNEAFGSASDLRVLRASGIESEMELPFAVLQQLCLSMLGHLEHLPGPQAGALRTAFGLRQGPPPDRFLVGLAVLSLLSEAARQQPLVCVVDDCQWLDQESAQALAFAARRIQAEGVLLAFAAREPSQDLKGIPEFGVGGLRDPDARALLRSVVPWPLDEQVRARILAETRGNPLALLELPRGLSPAELAGGFGLPQELSLSGRIKESFLRRVEGLTEATWLMVLIAAAEPVGNPALVWRAAARLGLTRDAAVSAEAAGLLTIGAHVVFRHPLVRSAVYGASSRSDRRRVHLVLAEVTDPGLDPDRRAWHLAQAAMGPDEEVAAELERSATRAQGRGGLAAAAAFLDRAVQLSLDPEPRARRALAAAQAKYLAGAPDAARRLLSTAEAGPLGELERSQVDMIRAQVAYSQNRGSDAPALLLRAARRLEPLDRRLARQTYLDAVLAGHFAGRLAPGSLREAAEAARRVPRAAGPPAAFDLLLDGLAIALTGGYAAGAATLTQAVRGFRSPEATPDEQLRWLWPAAHVAMALWDDESYEVLSARHIEIGREAGVLAVLPTALTTRIVSCAFAGQLTAAEELIEEMRTLADAMGTLAPPYGPVFVSAWRGREDAASEVIDTAVRDFMLSGEGAVLAFADYARAVLYNGLGRYQDALVAATATDAFEAEGVTIYTQGLAELVEAAARAGAPERAADGLARLSEMTRASDTDWGAGVRARSQALLSRDDTAETLYREAIERLGRTRVRPQLARARLLYGEWLRRENRRADARQELLQAFEMFTHMGMDAFSERARRELATAGEKVRRPTVERLHDLTNQETQIARLARDGLTNAEIGLQLYLSARTVEWHLRKVFAKLGITSRRQLQTAVL